MTVDTDTTCTEENFCQWFSSGQYFQKQRNLDCSCFGIHRTVFMNEKKKKEDL